MALPARMRGAADLVLGVDDLERARSVAPAVQYAYLSNPTGFLLGEIPLPTDMAKAAAGPAGTTGAVQVFVMPARSSTSGPADAAKPGAAAGGAGTAITADTVTKGAVVSGDDAKQLLSAKDLTGFSSSRVSAPDGPQPQLEYLHGMEVTPEFFVARGLAAAAGLGLAALLSRLMEQTIGFCALHAGLVIAGVAAAWTVVAACNVLPAAAAARMPAADAIRYE